MKYGFIEDGQCGSNIHTYMRTLAVDINDDMAGNKCVDGVSS